MNDDVCGVGGDGGGTTCLIAKDLDTSRQFDRKCCWEKGVILMSGACSMQLHQRSNYKSAEI